MPIRSFSTLILARSYITRAAPIGIELKLWRYALVRLDALNAAWHVSDLQCNPTVRLERFPPSGTTGYRLLVQAGPVAGSGWWIEFTFVDHDAFDVDFLERTER